MLSPLVIRQRQKQNLIFSQIFSILEDLCYSSSTQSLVMMADRSDRSWNPKSYKSKVWSRVNVGANYPHRASCPGNVDPQTIASRIAGKSLIFQELPAWFVVKGISVAYLDRRIQWWFLHKEETPVNLLWTQRAQNTLSMVLARSYSEHFCSFSTPHTHELFVDTVINMRSSFIRDSEAFDQGSLILKPFHRLHTEYLSLQFPFFWHCFHPVIAVTFQWKTFPKVMTWQCTRVG